METKGQNQEQKKTMRSQEEVEAGRKKLIALEEMIEVQND